MLILALESSAKACSCALLRDGVPLALCFQDNGLKHSVTLLPMAEDMLKNCGITMNELSLIAVAHGPGSFTGIRIGVSLAKGLAFGLGLPAAGVSTLAAMAWHGRSAPENAVICCVMDARRSQVYNALFEKTDTGPRRLCDDRAISIDELADGLRGKNDPRFFGKRVFLIGDGAEKCAQHIENSILATEPFQLQSAWGVAMEAAQTKPGDCHALRPVYLRPSQAERERQIIDNLKG